MMINSYKPFVFLRNKIKLIIMMKFSYKWEYWSYPPFIKPKLMILRFRKDKEYLFLCINKFSKIIFRIMRRNKKQPLLERNPPKANSTYLFDAYRMSYKSESLQLSILLSLMGENPLKKSAIEPLIVLFLF